MGHSISDWFNYACSIIIPIVRQAFLDSCCFPFELLLIYVSTVRLHLLSPKLQPFVMLIIFATSVTTLTPQLEPPPKQRVRLTRPCCQFILKCCCRKLAYHLVLRCRWFREERPRKLPGTNTPLPHSSKHCRWRRRNTKEKIHHYCYHFLKCSFDTIAHCTARSL